MPDPIVFTLPTRTSNPNNGATGNSKIAGIIRARKRKGERQAAWIRTRSAVGLTLRFPVVVTVCRVAPSNGLDPHDGLGASLKGTIDGIADGLGLKNDRDKRVTWVLDQRRGPWAVEVKIEPKGEAHAGE
jgi:hypothetical protein